MSDPAKLDFRGNSILYEISGDSPPYFRQIWQSEHGWCVGAKRIVRRAVARNGEETSSAAGAGRDTREIGGSFLAGFARFVVFAILVHGPNIKSVFAREDVSCRQ